MRLYRCEKCGASYAVLGDRHPGTCADRHPRTELVEVTEERFPTQEELDRRELELEEAAF